MENIFNALKTGKLQYIKSIIDDDRKQVYVKNETGQTALMIAAIKNDEQLVRLLLRNGAEINEKDTFLGCTPLIWASHYKAKEVVKILIDKEAKIDVQDNTGMTALMTAAGANALEVVMLLLKSGAKKDVKNNKGDDALMVAVRKNAEEVVKFLETNK